MPQLTDVQTPALLLDRSKLDQNLKRMQTHVDSLGVRLRPHMKTAKSIEVARRAVGEHGAITVSTLAEAEAFFDAGYSDILYAVGIVPAKLDRAADLRRRGADLQIIVDSTEMAEAVVNHGDHRVWIEIDSDGRRAGVSPADEKALCEIAARLDDGLVGVLTHCGGSYDSGDDLERLGFARMERDAAVLAAETLLTSGFDCGQVSVGSTPTVTIAEDLEGVTEVRPGVYMFMDLFQAGLGVCEVDDIALSVEATVIGRRRDGVVVDAGALALSLDRSTSKQADDLGYGIVCDLDGTPLDDLVVQRVSQEHGVVISRTESRVHLELGTTVRILPNHACMTAAAHNGYHVVDGGEVVDYWPRTNGW